MSVLKTNTDAFYVLFFAWHSSFICFLPLYDFICHQWSVAQAFRTNVQRNEYFQKLVGSYLFPEVAKRRKAYVEQNPNAKIISFGVGDTTQPIPKHILSGLVNGATKLGTREGYSGYDTEHGLPELRQKIAKVLYNNCISADEVFVSDGAKCDLGRLQQVFGPKVHVHYHGII